MIMFLTAFLNVVLSEVLPSILFYFKYIGALYIIYLILRINNFPKSSSKEMNTTSYSFKEGILLQLANPKVLLYGISIFSSFIIEHTTSYVVLSLFSLSFSTLAFLSVNIWAITGDKLQSQIKKHHLLFQILTSGGLIYSVLTILDIL